MMSVRPFRFLLLFILVAALMPVAAAHAQDTPAHILDAAIAAANQNIPALGNPNRWQHILLPPTANTALGCQQAAGTPLAAPVTPYQVTLFFNDVGYVVHVSADGSLTQLCDPKFTGTGQRPAVTPDPAAPGGSAGQCVLTPAGAFSNVRAEPAEAAVQIATIFGNTAHNVLGRNADSTWYLIAQGWVAGSAVTLSGPCGALPLSTAVVPPGDTGPVVPAAPLVTACPPGFAGYLVPRIQLGPATAQVESGGSPNRLREDPSLNAPIVGQAQPGRRFDNVLNGPACNQGIVWWQVALDGLVGWTAESDVSSGDYFIEPVPGFEAPGVDSGVEIVPAAVGGPFPATAAPITYENSERMAILASVQLNEAREAAFAPDGARLAVRDADGVHIFSFPGLQREPMSDALTVNNPAVTSESLAFSADGRFLAVGFNNGTIQVADFQSGQVTTLANGHQSVVGALAFSPAANLLASGSGRETGLAPDTADTSVKLWDIDAMNAPTGATPILLNFLFPQALQELAFSEDGTRLAVASQAAVWVYEVPAGELIFSRGTNPVGFNFLTPLPDRWDPGRPGGFVFSSAGDAQVVFPAAGEVQPLLDNADLIVGHVIFSPVSSQPNEVVYIAASFTPGAFGADDEFAVYNNLSPIPALRAPMTSVLDLAISPDGRALAMVVLSGDLWFWGLR